MATNAVNDSNPASALYASLNGTKAADSKSAVSEQQNRFLTLLTAQLKNQDPLNPMDNAQMTSQMAQISTVDSLERLNAALQQLLSNSTETQTLQAAALVNHSVLVPGKETVLNQGVAAAGIELTDPADSVIATVTDKDGATVRTLRLGALDAGVHGFTWDGKTDSGAAAADGTYKFSLEATVGDKKLTPTALQLGVVSSVDRSGGSVQLNLGNLGLFTMADVKQIF